MKETGKAAIGEIAFGGREHLVAIAASNGAAGMMAYMLRYGTELRKSEEYFSQIPQVETIDKKQLAMAMQLIDAYSRPFDLDAFQDDYEVALRELIEAKQKDIPLPAEEEAPEPTKVINLMDALRESVSKARRPVASERRPAQKGPVLVGAGKRKGRAA